MMKRNEANLDQKKRDVYFSSFIFKRTVKEKRKRVTKFILSRNI